MSLRRILQLLPVLLIASLLHLGDDLRGARAVRSAAIVGENATPEQIAAATKQLGLDRPVLVQYCDLAERALRGDLGTSIHSREPVLRSDRRSACPRRSSSPSPRRCRRLLLGVPVAIVGAVAPGSWLDRALSGWSALALGVPTFWLGILLILLFAVELRWLPSASGYVPFWESPLQMLRNIALPALTLGVYVSGIFARFLRASLVAELQADYVRTARSKGLRERDIVGRPRHAQRAPAVRDHRRPDDGELHRRRGGDRGGVHLSGTRAPADPGDQHARLPADPGLHPGHPGHLCRPSTWWSTCSTPISTRASSTPDAACPSFESRRPRRPRRPGALVTGASRGLAMAQVLAGAGARVVLNGRDAATLEPRRQALAAMRASSRRRGVRRHATQAAYRRRDRSDRPRATGVSTSCRAMPARSCASRCSNRARRIGAASSMRT